MRYGGEDYYQRKTHYHFNNMHGEEYDDNARLTIEYGEAIPEPRAIDHYRIGTAYLLNAREPLAAHRHFRQALDHIINGTLNHHDEAFIIERIDDYKDHFMDFAEIEELPLQEALMVHINNMNETIKAVEKKKPEIKISENDPEFTQKMLLAQRTWHSDSQNVHDSAIYQEIYGQLKHVISENAMLKNNYMHTYEEVITWLRIKFEEDKERLSKVSKVVEFLNMNNQVGALHDVFEQDIITNVWRRSYDPRNKAKFNAIREALADNVLDCVEGKMVVCTAGRTAKIWSSLAKLDFDPAIGILKSKQLLRNEIYEKCAKIVDDYVGKSGSASAQLKTAYMNSENTEQVKELITCIHNEIDELKKQYSGLLPDEQLYVIFEECKAVV